MWARLIEACHRRSLIEECIFALHQDRDVGLVRQREKVVHPVEAYIPRLNLWVRKYDGYISGYSPGYHKRVAIYPSWVSRIRIQRAFKRFQGEIDHG